MKTFQLKGGQIKRDWHLVDVEGKVLGRTATDIARLLSGKHKVTYTPHMDSGDYVVVINAAKVKVTGRKEEQKTYYKHSGFPGGFKAVAFSKLRKEQPEKIIRLAVYGMLPGNRLRNQRMKRLLVFKGVEHPYQDKFQTADKKE
jgi:large subunit ribosomal protein L13